MGVQNNQSAEQQVALYCYLTVNQLCDKHKAFKIGGVRAQIFNEEKNGLKESGAILRNGRKILINEAKWFAWLEAGNQGGA
ncbi:MAG: hypothetical protein Q8L79_07710 [Methylobacter sp.]|uniref:hypothetical protein n=1 Tax=Methylobacter sp. TaxID=2051955 RepID=UPI002730A2B5|nr:hypothetical protein [Methylobacter sp.]MDP1664999.1 hypothetical protein [Methylobacter sp.]